VTNVPSFERVRNRGVYPGVDVVYYGQRKQLENEFIVAPGAEPASIRMEIQGADSTTVDSAGDLVVSINDEELRWKKPSIYQQDGASRRPIDGGYTLAGSHVVGFRFSNYDRGKPLVIDPVLLFSTYYGRNADEVGIRIALDPAGNIVVADTTSSVNFPTAAGLAAPAQRGSVDTFAIKISADGSRLLLSDVFGGDDRSVVLG
jgi:hypothetical protein